EGTGEEVGYLLDEVRRVLPDLGAAEREVVYTYAGVRPLSFEDRARASDVSRKHKVVVEGGGRFLSVTGTKLTCFRSLAEQVGDQVLRTLGRRAECRTARLALAGQDVLFRRTGIGTSRCQGQDCAETIGRRMATLLGWSPRRLAAELDAWESHVARSQRFRSARA